VNSPELRRRDAHHAPEDLREMVGWCSHFKADLDETGAKFRGSTVGAVFVGGSRTVVDHAG